MAKTDNIEFSREMLEVYLKSILDSVDSVKEAVEKVDSKVDKMNDQQQILNSTVTKNTLNIEHLQKENEEVKVENKKKNNNLWEELRRRDKENSDNTKQRDRKIMWITAFAWTIFVTIFKFFDAE